MEIKERKLKGTFEITLKPHMDSRGFFMRAFDDNIFKEKCSINIQIMYKTTQIDEIEVKKNLGDTISYIDSIFIGAIESETSDIHIEPLKEALLIRFRQD